MGGYTLEETITVVIQHARLRNYEPPTLCQVEQIDNNIFGAEIVALPTVVAVERYSERDVQTLNHHYKYLKEKCFDEACKMNRNYYEKYNQAIWECQVYGITSIDIEKMQMQCDDFKMRYQYYLLRNIQFLTIARVPYDRFGRICTVKFRLV